MNLFNDWKPLSAVASGGGARNNTAGFFFVLVGRRGEKNHIYSEHELFLASRTQAAGGHRVTAADSDNKPLLSLAVD